LQASGQTDVEADFTYSVANCRVSCTPTYSGPGIIITRTWFFYDAHPGTLPCTTNFTNPSFDLTPVSLTAPGKIIQMLVIKLPNGQMIAKSHLKKIYEPCETGHCGKVLFRYDARGCKVNFGPSYFPQSTPSMPVSPIILVNWDFGDGTSSTQLSPTHTYTSTGTYIVTVTDNHGYVCSKIINIGECNSGGHNLCCDSDFLGNVIFDCGKLNLSLLSVCLEGTHSWDIQTNPSNCIATYGVIPNSPVQSIQLSNINANTVTSLKITHKLICEDGTEKSTTNVIDLPFDGIYIGRSEDISYLNEYECVLPGNSYSGTAKIFSTGTVKINKDFTFSGSSINMESKAGFDVEAINTFTLKLGTKISSVCDCLWRGINVRGTLVTESYTSISDALSAVRPYSGAKLNLKLTRFKKNYVSLYSLNSNFSMLGFESNEFDGSGMIKAKCNLILKLKNNGVSFDCGIAPTFAFSPELGYAGVYLDGVTAFNLNSLTRSKQNKFSNFVVGMAFYDTNVNINKNSYFVDMQEGMAYGSHDDTGILFVDSESKGEQSFIFKGNGKNSTDFDFDKCKTGVLALASSNGSTGINISDTRVLNSSSSIIGIGGCGSFKGSIAYNYLQSNQPNVDNIFEADGIFITDWVNESSALKINNNKIDANQKNGIELKQPIANWGLGDTELDIFRNEIHVSAMHGIFSDGGRFVNIHDNAPSSTDANLGIFVEGGKTGITQSTGNNNNVACNFIKSTTPEAYCLGSRKHIESTITNNHLIGGDYGLGFSGDCNLSVLKCNTMEDNAKYGLYLYGGGKIGKQGTDMVESLGNKWVGTFINGAFADGSVPLNLSKIYVRDLAIENPTANTLPWIYVNVPISNIPTCQACPTLFNVTDLPPKVTDSDLSIANSKVDYLWYPKTSRWTDEANLYEKLFRNPSLTANNDILKQFYNDKSETPMAKLINISYDFNNLYDLEDDVKEKMNGLTIEIDNLVRDWKIQDSLIQINEGIVQQIYLDKQDKMSYLIDSFQNTYALIRSKIDSNLLVNYVAVKEKLDLIETYNTIEINFKVSLSKWAKHRIEHLPYTDEDLEMLKEVAVQCVDEGGNYVLMAKMMYESTTGLHIEEGCQNIGNRSIEENQSNLFSTINTIQVYPNPANNTLQIDFGKEKTSEDYSISITNLLGTNLHTQSIRSTEISNIDISKLPVGACIVVVNQGKQTVFRKIVIINH
jgi:hypothetical protein